MPNMIEVIKKLSVEVGYYYLNSDGFAELRPLPFSLEEFEKLEEHLKNEVICKRTFIK